MPIENLKDFQNTYSRRDLLDNIKIGLRIPEDEDDDANENFILNSKKKPIVDLPTMSDKEKKDFEKSYPGIAVNPLYAKPMFFFLPFFKTGITEAKAEKDPYYVEINGSKQYLEFFFTRSCILMLTWAFGIHTTLLALRGRDKKLREYDFPTEKYYKPYTKIEPGEEEEKEALKRKEHGGTVSPHYHDAGEMVEGSAKATTGGGKAVEINNLEKLFSDLEDNIEQRGGGDTAGGTAGGTAATGKNDYDILGKVMACGSSEEVEVEEEPVDEPKDCPKNKLKLQEGFAMTLDYTGDERYRITQSKINSESGGTGFEQGEHAYLSTGPDKASSFMLGGSNRGPKFKQFYSYVMRNSTRTINRIFNIIFKKMGGFIGKDEKSYDNAAMKIFIIIHVFAVMSFFINSSTVLLTPFIIVLAWIFKYAFMSKYSGPAAMTMVFDFSGLGSILLRNAPFGGLIIGAILFLIPGIPLLISMVTIPIWILFKTWFWLLVGHSFTKYGREWGKKMFRVNWQFILFEILLINAIAIDKYYPDNRNNPFLSSFMRDGLGKSAPIGVMLGIFYTTFKKTGSLITPIIYCVLSVILTKIICEI
jgi:hypothetical protein